MKWLAIIFYLAMLFYGTYWLIGQTGNYWWILLMALLLPNMGGEK